MRLIDEWGVAVPLRRILDRVAARDGFLHVSLDIDFLDPSLAPGVGTTVPGGATYREAHLIMEMIHDSGLMGSLDIVELNPFLDDRGRSALILVDLVASLFWPPGHGPCHCREPGVLAFWMGMRACRAKPFGLSGQAEDRSSGRSLELCRGRRLRLSRNSEASMPVIIPIAMPEGSMMLIFGNTGLTGTRAGDIRRLSGASKFGSSCVSLAFARKFSKRALLARFVLSSSRSSTPASGATPAGATQRSDLLLQRGLARLRDQIVVLERDG